MEQKCNFCSDLELFDKFNIKELKPEYTVALVSGYINSAGQTTYYGYKLRFCPECGKAIDLSGRK